MDWDLDGKLDIISGCYWTEGAEAGQIQFLKGKGGLDFEEAVALKNVAGKPLENLQLDGDDRNQTSTICTQQHAVDYDGDGDLDLVVGCFGPNFYLYENKADEENGEPSIAEEVIELPIKSPSYHSAPHLVDWDNDGDLDLLSGSGNGGVLLSRNTGTRQEPVWSKFTQLVASSDLREQSTSGGAEIKMSPSTRVWATDFNGDGLLDLLVGDSANIVNPAKGVGPEEFKRLRAEHESNMESIGKKQQPLMEKYQTVMEAGEDPDPELEAEMEKVQEEFMKVYQSRDKFQESKSTGFDWLLIRKPETAQISESVTQVDAP